MTETERRLRSQIAANESWAQTPDCSARAAHLRKAHFQRLALKPAQSRRKARCATEAELQTLGGVQSA